MHKNKIINMKDFLKDVLFIEILFVFAFCLAMALNYIEDGSLDKSTLIKTFIVTNSLILIAMFSVWSIFLPLYQFLFDSKHDTNV